MCQWIYGMFLDLIAFVANALLGVMSTDLEFFETSVPIVITFYNIFVAVGWGLLIGNCAFQAMKAMFSGLGFEGESPAILLVRTGIFGFLLVFSKQICEIGLGIGKQVIELIGIPDHIEITMPDENNFGSVGSSWILVIIVGFILGFQMIKLFFEIGERYTIVAVLTLLCPIGLAMGGSKSTKEICAGYIRTFASMLVMMVMNVLFLRLILSALSTMPGDELVLPWCVLVVGLARVARKVDNLISKIGLNPAITGDPLGHGGHAMATVMAVKSIVSAFGSKGGGKGTGFKNGGTSARTYGGSSYPQNRSSASVGGMKSEAFSQAQTSQTNRFGGNSTFTNTQTTQSSRFGAQNTSANRTGSTNSNVHFGAAGVTGVNTNRFGAKGTMSKGAAKVGIPKKTDIKSGAKSSASKPGIPKSGQVSKIKTGTVLKPSQFGTKAFPKSQNTFGNISMKHQDVPPVQEPPFKGGEPDG